MNLFTSVPSLSKTAPLSCMSCSEGFCNTCQVLIQLPINTGACNLDQTEVFLQAFATLVKYLQLTLEQGSNRFSAHLLTCLEFLQSTDLLSRHDINTVCAPNEERGGVGKSSYRFTPTPFHVRRETERLGTQVLTSYSFRAKHLNCI